jgi:hypothetical protein
MIARLSVGVSLGTLACAGPALDLPAPRDSLELVIQPNAGLEEVPAIFRGRLRGMLAGAELWLFRGELSDHYDRAVRERELSSTLLGRAVPLRYWREQDDHVLQPLVWLDAGEVYTLAVAGHGRAFSLRVAGEIRDRATRFFPPEGAAKHQAVVLCGGALSESPPPPPLEPGALPLHVEPGAFGAPLAGCVTFSTERALLAPAVGPAAHGGVLLDPAPFLPQGAPPTPVACAMGVASAGACLETQDDRIYVTPFGTASLWLLSEPARPPLSAAAFARTPLLRGLPPETGGRLLGEVISSHGERTPLDISFETTPSRRHLVLSEVLANALGPEPESEWIEVVNDSLRPAELSGVWLEDASGRVPLPEATLEPGETVVLVSASFRSSGLDVPLASGTRVLELPSLGQRGLSNAGEMLLLVASEGVLSRFPMLPAAHPGVSIARRSLDATDDSAHSFAEHGAPGASPGAANFFD